MATAIGAIKCCQDGVWPDELDFVYGASLANVRPVSGQRLGHSAPVEYTEDSHERAPDGSLRRIAEQQH